METVKIEIDILESKINKLEKTPVLIRASLMMPILRQFIIVLRCFAVNK